MDSKPPTNRDIREALRALSSQNNNEFSLDDSEGSMIGGKYVIETLLACEGQATVAVAFDPKLNRKVVLKLYHRNSKTSEKTRTVNEGRALASIESPHVVRCLSVEELEDDYLLVLEHIDGVNLEEHVESTSVVEANALRLFRQLILAIHSVHEKGLLHLDLKPSNAILTSNGTLKLIDFGLVVQSNTDFSFSSGTSAFMAPEVADRTDQYPVDQRTDIFGLGAVLYFLLSGCAPFEATSSKKSRELAVIGAIKPVEEFVPDVSPRLRRLCAKCLAHDPAERYSNTDELLAATDRLIGSRGKRVWMFATIALVALTVAIMGFVFNSKKKQDDFYEKFNALNSARATVSRLLCENKWNEAVGEQQAVVEIASHPFFQQSHNAEERMKLDCIRQVTNEFDAEQKQTLSRAFGSYGRIAKGEFIGLPDKKKELLDETRNVFHKYFPPSHYFVLHNELLRIRQLKDDKGNEFEDKQLLLKRLLELDKEFESLLCESHSKIGIIIKLQIIDVFFRLGEFEKNSQTSDFLLRTLESKSGYPGWKAADTCFSFALQEVNWDPDRSSRLLDRGLKKLKDIGFEPDTLHKYDLSRCFYWLGRIEECIRYGEACGNELANYPAFTEMRDSVLFMAYARQASEATGIEDRRRLKDKALFYFKKSESNYLEATEGLPATRGEIESNFAEAFCNLGDYRHAYDYAEQAVETYGQSSHRFFALFLCGECALKIGRIDSAKLMADRILESLDEIKKHKLTILRVKCLLFTINSDLQNMRLKGAAKTIGAMRKTVAERLQTDHGNRKFWKECNRKLDEFQLTIDQAGNKVP